MQAYNADVTKHGDHCTIAQESDPKETNFKFCNTMKDCWQEVKSDVEGGESTYPGSNDKCGLRESCATVNLNSNSSETILCVLTRNCGLKKQDWWWKDFTLTSDNIDCKWPGPKEEKN